MPPALVRQKFRLLATSNSTQQLVAQHPALLEFIRYMEQNYLNGQFPLAFWNVFNRNGDSRTNNNVEG